MYQKRIMPTEDELKILRSKLCNNKEHNISPIGKHSIGVGPSQNSKSLGKGSFNSPMQMEEVIRKNSFDYVKSISHNEILHNDFHNEIDNVIPSNLDDANECTVRSNQDSNLIQMNHELMRENELLKIKMKQIEKLKDNLTLQEIIKEYTFLKTNETFLKDAIRERDKKIFQLEKENKFLREDNTKSSSNINTKSFVLSLLNKQILDSKGQMILSQLFDSRPEGVKFLLDRIEALEFQNFSLISKVEKYSVIMSGYIDEIIEHLDILSDIRNAFGRIQESETFSTDIQVIKEILSKKGEYIQNKKDKLIREREIITREQVREKNQVILCKDKVVESKFDHRIGGKLREIIDDRIEMYEHIKLKLSHYEDYVKFMQGEGKMKKEVLPKTFKMSNDLLLENQNLNLKNFQMRNLIWNMCNYGVTEENLEEANQVLNSTRDLLINHDLIFMLRCQSLMIENSTK